MPVPEIRIRPANTRPPEERGRYVLYWMIAQRRLEHNFALDRAVEWCRRLRLTLLILEPLRSDYRWASDRLHRFVLQGMAEHRRYCEEMGAAYHPYVEPRPGAGKGLLAELAKEAAVVVTDDFPCFFLPRMVKAAAVRLPMLCEAVDSNGLLPLAACEQVFARAYDFRRFLQKNLAPYLSQWPSPQPLGDLPHGSPPVPEEVLARWGAPEEELLRGEPARLAELPIDHQVGSAAFAGGRGAARQLLREFLETKLPRYEEDRSHPDRHAASGLSPYLHFGHIGAHEVLLEIARREDWSPGDVGGKSAGQREGWWRMSSSAEAFLDELVTWRELGHNFCAGRDDYDRYESLPEWARATLAEHQADPREAVYSLEELEAAATHDPVWNAAQRQLLREGRLQNYLRMLWGKKILEWSPTPRRALEVMIELNNKYAVDGRDPNSYSGIFWVLGRYDRAWGPERPVYGKIRYMSSENTVRKLEMKEYLAAYGA